jgi:hypothetical protein
MNSTYNDANMTADELRAAASKKFQDAEDSFDRCDTDGFLSQWASGISADRLRLAAEIKDNGGVWSFPVLFDLEGNRVPAKLIRVVDQYRGFGKRTRAVWALVNPANPEGSFLGFVSPSTGGKRSVANLAAKGYVEGSETAPAAAVIQGSGTGLSGNAWAAVVRTDRGW